MAMDIEKFAEKTVPVGKFKLEEKWLKEAKTQKKAWVYTTESGDIPPTVFVERDDELLCIVIAPQVDKELGLQAILFMKKGFDPDYLTIMLDAHTTLMGGKSIEEQKRMAEKYIKKPGSMQKACDEEGACELGEIADCIVVQRVDRDGNMVMATLPYSYHGKGTKFTWMDEHSFIMDETKDGARIGGFVADNIRHIMKHEKPIIEEVKEKESQLNHLFREWDLDEIEAVHRSGRAALGILITLKNFVALVGPTLAKYGEFSSSDIQFQRIDEVWEKSEYHEKENGNGKEGLWE
jgi:hypothetical protein